MAKKRLILKSILLLSLIITYGTFDTIKLMASIVGLSSIEDKDIGVPDWVYDLMITSFYYDWLFVLSLLILVLYRWEIESGVKSLTHKLTK